MNRGLHSRPLRLECLERRTLLSLTVSTEEPAYPAGEMAAITAAGFTPGETIELQVLHIDDTPNTGTGHDPWQVTDGADGDLDGAVDGNILTTWLVAEDDSIGSTFEVTATAGTSGDVALAQFGTAEVTEWENPEPLSVAVLTDRPDYDPADTATITAIGFAQGETVQFQVLHVDDTPNTGSGHDPWQVTDGADGDLDGLLDGSVQTTWLVAEDDSMGSIFEVTATGLTSGEVATGHFTDAQTITLLYEPVSYYGSLNSSNWSTMDVETDYDRSYAGPCGGWGYAIEFDGNDELLVSRSFDLTSYADPRLSYYVQRKGREDSPESYDHLHVQYRNSSGSWVSLQTESVYNTSTAAFYYRSISLPAGAIHGSFAFRFDARDSDGYGDDWFVDNVTLTGTLVSQVDHFDWSAVSTPQEVDQPFSVTITAKDSAGSTLTEYTDTVDLSGWVGSGTTSHTILDGPSHSGSGSGNYTLGNAFTPNTDVVVTDVRHYFGSKVSIWTDAGTLLASVPVTSVPGTWVETALSSPLELESGSTYRVAAYTGGSTSPYYYRTDLASTFAHGTIDEGYYSSGDAFPTSTTSAQWWFVGLRYDAGSTDPVAIAPTASGSFVDGVWTGNVTVNEAADDVYLRADDGSGHTGDSNRFDVEPADTTTPTVTGRIPSPGSTINSSSVDVDVTFSEPVQGVEVTDLVLTGTAASGASVGTPTNPSGNTWRFPVGGLCSGGLNVSLAPDTNDVEDLAGNDLANLTWSYTIDLSVDHFDWSAVSTPQDAGQPFSVTITAKDGAGSTLTEYTDTVDLSGWVGSGTTSHTILDGPSHSGSGSGNYTLGNAFTPNTDVVVTDVRHYFGSKVSIWTDAGALLASVPVTSVSGTWVETALSSPLELESGSTYRVAAYTGGSTSPYYYRTDLASTFAHGTIDEDYHSSGDAFPTSTSSAQWWLVGLRYDVGPIDPVAITPTATGSFVDGVWTGNVTVNEAADDVYLRADDGSGHTGDSNTFKVISAPSTPPSGVDLVASSDTGVSDTDDVTNLDNSAAGKTLQFDVSGTISGATVTVYADGTAIGSALAGGTTTTVTTNASYGLSDDTHLITARQIESGKRESGDSFSLSITVDTVAPAAPSAPDLQSGSDSGVSNTDNVTNDDTPTFDVAATPYFRFCRDGAPISEYYETGSSYELSTQSDATYEYAIRAVDAAGNESPLGTVLNVTIDTSAPTADILNVTPDPRPTSVAEIDIAFGEPIWGLDVSDLALTRDSGSDLLAGSGTSTLTTADNVTWTLDGLSTLTADPGSYALTLAATGSGITDIAGNSLGADATDTWLNNRSAAPSAVDLLPVSDTGVDDTDNVTRRNNSEAPQTLQFLIGGTTAGATVGVYANGTEIGSAVAGGASTVVVTDGVQGLADGGHVITARQTEVSKTESADSPSLILTVDTESPRVLGLAQLSKLMPDDAGAGIAFAKVALDGTTAVVGSPGATNASSVKTGAVYVFQYDDSQWMQTAKLTAADGAANDWFGWSVDVDGDSIIVGATGADDNGSGSGSAYVFARSDGAWNQVAKWAGGQEYDSFGGSVSISGNTAIVGAPGAARSFGREEGRAYIYRKTDSGWTHWQSLGPPDSLSYENPVLWNFGCSVSISGGTAVVGNAQHHGNGSGSGAAYMWQLMDEPGWTDVWECTAILRPGNTFDYFGRAVAIDGSTAVIGAYGASGWYAGAAYIFADNGSGWGQVQKLTAADGEDYDFFGYQSVSISGDTVVVGAEQDDDNGEKSGSAYVFEKVGATWVQVRKLVPDDGATSDYFGSSVAVSNHRVMVGAYRADASGADSGAVYVFADPEFELDEDRGADPRDKLTSDATPTAGFQFSESVFSDGNDVEILDPVSVQIMPDSIAGWGGNALDISFLSSLVRDGEYTITLSDDGTITDAAGNALAEGAGRPFHFTLDTAPPVLTDRSPAPGTVITETSFYLDLTITGDVYNVDRTDLRLSGSAAATAHVGSAMPTGENTWQFYVYGLSEGALTVWFPDEADDVEDPAGNDLPPTWWTYIVDTETPSVTGATVSAANQVDVRFSEPMGTGVEDPGSYLISGSGKGSLGDHPDGVTDLGDHVYRLTWNTGEMVIGADVTITATGVADLANTPVGDPSSATHVGGGIGVAPAVTAVLPDNGSVVTSSSVDVDVTFSEPMQPPEACGLLLSGSASPIAVVGTPVHTSGDTWCFPITNIVEGTLELSLGQQADTIEDLVGNDLGLFEWDYSIEGLPPAVVDVHVVSGLVVDVTFNEVMGSGVMTPDNYTVSGTGRGTLADRPDSAAHQTGNTYRLTWNHGEMTDGGDVTITAAGVQDAGGMVIGDADTYTHVGGGIGLRPWVANRDFSFGPANLVYTNDWGYRPPKHVSVLDMDRDGDPDVLGAIGDSVGHLGWWENTSGSGSTWVYHSIDGNCSFVYIPIAADVDGDGDFDVTVLDGSHRGVLWWENIDGSGGTWARHGVEEDIWVYSVCVEDVDGDGDSDLLASTRPGSYGTITYLYWWENLDGAGGGWNRHTVRSWEDDAIAAGDLDGDGDMDVVTDNTWLENMNGSGTSWASHTIGGSASPYGGLSVADVDGDGDLDILKASSADGVVWWENAAGDATTWTAYTIDSASASAARCVDMDADGDMDVVGAGGNYAVWWENISGDGSAWVKHNAGYLYHVNSADAADLDGDGDMDVVGAGTSEDIVWWANTDKGTVAVQSTRSVDVTFSESMGAGALDAGNYTVTGSGKGALADHPNSAALVSGNTYRLTWNDGEMLDGGDVIITVASASDLAGNPIGIPNSGVHTGGAIGERPSVVGQLPAPDTRLASSDVNIDVAFSEPMRQPDTSKLYLSGSASYGDTIIGTPIDLGGGMTWRLPISGLLDGTLKIGIGYWSDGFEDLAGNDVIYSSWNYIVDAAPPAILDVQAQGLRTIDVTFSEFMGAGVADPANYTLSGPGKGSLTEHPDSVMGWGNNIYRLTWNDGEMFDGGDLTIAVNPALEDSTGTVMGGQNVATHVGGGFGVVPIVQSPDKPFGVRNTVDGDFNVARSVHAEDVDGDGDLDIIGVAFFGDNVIWWENTSGTGMNWMEHVVDSDFNGAQAVYAADMDGDGDMDIIGAAYYADAVIWWENSDGAGTVWTRHIVDDSFDGATGVYAADVDGDGDFDLLGGAQVGDEFAWWENSDGAGTVWIDHHVASFNIAGSVSAADLDADGDVDFIGTAGGDNVFAWWENIDGTGTTWDMHQLWTTPGYGTSGPETVSAEDLDGDGDLDILATSSLSYEPWDVSWFENDTDQGIWTHHVIANDFNGAYAACAADVDGDGDKDVLAASGTGDKVVWWDNLNGKASVWTRREVDGGFDGAYDVCAADIDGDGNTDFIGAAQYADDVAWWENQLPSAVAVHSGSTIDVRFSEPMNDTAIVPGNYSVSGTGRGTLAEHPDSAEFVSDTTYRLAWNAGSMVHGGDVTITVSGVTDVAGNPIGSPNRATHVGGGIGAPVAHAGGPYVLDLGDDLLLDGSGSYHGDPDDSIVGYAWDLDNDGQFDDVVTTDATSTVPYTTLQALGIAMGTYPLGLQVTDTHGATGTDSTTLEVASCPAVVGVMVNDGAAQRSMVTSLTVSFDRAISLAPEAFELLRRDGPPVAVTATLSPDATDAVLTFDSNSDGLYGDPLEDGVYDLTVFADYVFTFHRLYGDGDGDADVDGTDLLSFRGTFGKTLGMAGYLSYFDHDGDDDVDYDDYAAFRANYRKLLMY